ncbi:MAG: recombination protein RecR, partial [Planctomycetes bacterium]|nr:recombination protein RecR [Planctomycetota bacterium]
AKTLGASIQEVVTKLTKCRSCFTVSENELCPICADKDRDHSKVCVVETPRDLLAIEASGAWKGVYHVLLGRLSPTEGIGEGDLTIAALVKRCRAGSISEVMLSTNPDLAGDATAMAVTRAIEGLGVKLTRPARGVPVGHQLDHLAGRVLSEAIAGRSALEHESEA